MNRGRIRRKDEEGRNEERRLVDEGMRDDVK